MVQRCRSFSSWGLSEECAAGWWFAWSQQRKVPNTKVLKTGNCLKPVAEIVSKCTLGGSLTFLGDCTPAEKV